MLLRSKCLNRKHRKQLAATMRDFLDGKLSAFEFDESVLPFYRSDDATVKFVAAQTWYFYDDCKDHYVHFHKPAWDFFQRLLLILDSNAHVTKLQRTRWHWTQLLPPTTLLVSIIALVKLGPLLSLAIFIIPVCLIAYYTISRRWQGAFAGPYSDLVAPFHSFAELRDTYESTPKFSKQRYPRGIHKPIRTKLKTALVGLPLVFWPIFLALALLAHTLPMRWVETHVSAG